MHSNSICESILFEVVENYYYGTDTLAYKYKGRDMKKAETGCIEIMWDAI